jgi:hypothetical protein
MVSDLSFPEGRSEKNSAIIISPLKTHKPIHKRKKLLKDDLLTSWASESMKLRGSSRVSIVDSSEFNKPIRKSIISAQPTPYKIEHEIRMYDYRIDKLIGVISKTWSIIIKFCWQQHPVEQTIYEEIVIILLCC